MTHPAVPAHERPTRPGSLEPPGEPGSAPDSAAPASSSKRRAWRLVQGGVAVAILGVLLWKVDWREAAAIARDVQPRWLGLVLLVSTVDRLWMAGKWHYLVRGFGIPAGFFRTALTYNLALLAGMTLQSQLAGDVTRAVRLGQTSGRRRLAAASVIFEKLAGFATCGILATGSLALLNRQFNIAPWQVAAPLLILLAVAFAAAPLSVVSRPGASVLAWFARSFPRLSSKVGLDMHEVSGKLREVRGACMVFVLLTLGEQFMPLVTNSLLQRALHLEVGWYETAAVVPIIIFISRLPISIDGFGIYEGMSVVLFGVMGLSTAQGFSLAVAGRLAGLASTLVAALICWVGTRRRSAAQ